METILETTVLTKKFKGLIAVNQLHMEVGRGEIHGLIGPNGSGKSTTINLLTGFLNCTEGRISFNDRAVQMLNPHQRAALGLVRTFQEPAVFAKLTVMQNMQAAINHASGKIQYGMTAEEVLGLLGLLEKRTAISGDLSYGEQKLLDLAKVIMLGPPMILLDEPAAGLSFAEKQKLIGVIRTLKEKGGTVLFSEHDVGLVMSLCDRITVLNFGSKIADGNPEDVRNNQKVIEAYLGGSA